jgi:hypothetical protein
VLPLHIFRCDQKTSNHAFANGHYAHQKRVFGLHMIGGRVAPSHMRFSAGYPSLQVLFRAALTAMTNLEEGVKIAKSVTLIEIPRQLAATKRCLILRLETSKTSFPSASFAMERFVTISRSWCSVQVAKYFKDELRLTAHLRILHI